jgi:hypothetical protein
MTFTYTPEIDGFLAQGLGAVRLLIFDIDSTKPIFQDSEINAFLTLESSNTKRAAALAFETIARQQTLIQKVMRLLSLQTDGAKLGTELRAQAKLLRDQAEFEEAESNAAGVFDIAEQVFDDFSWRDRLTKEAYRQLP